MITNYATLQSFIADQLNRQDLTAQIPTFIQNAEASLRRRVEGLTTLTGTLVLGAATVTLPDDVHWLESLVVTGPNGVLVPVAPATTVGVLQARAAQPSGVPVVYHRNDGAIMLGPVPDQSYAGIILYEPFLNLSATQTTNWLLTEAPDAYLYGALVEASPFLKDDARVGLWQQRYDRIIQEIKNTRDRRQLGTGALNAQAVPSLVFG